MRHQDFKDNNIHPRRDFYPLIFEFPIYRKSSPAHRDNSRW